MSSESGPWTKDRIGNWNTEPWTAARVAEMLVRALTGMLVGLVVSAALLRYGGESLLTALGFAAPALFCMSWFIPANPNVPGGGRSD